MHVPRMNHGFKPQPHQQSVSSSRLFPPRDRTQCCSPCCASLAWLPVRARPPACVPSPMREMGSVRRSLSPLSSPSMAFIDLDGTWSLSNGTGASYLATVPGQVHMDLLSNGVIGTSLGVPLRNNQNRVKITNNNNTNTPLRRPVLPLQRRRLPVDSAVKLDIHTCVHAPDRRPRL